MAVGDRQTNTQGEWYQRDNESGSQFGSSGYAYSSGKDPTETEGHRVFDPTARGGYAAPETGQYGTYVYGSQTDKDIDRYRALAAHRQIAPQMDQRDADQARGLQMGSLARLANASRGGAPSRAAILGQQGIADATRAGSQAAAGARGPGAAVAASRMGLAGAGQQMARGAGGAIDSRVGEIGAERAAYVGGAQGIHGQDIGAATKQAQLDAAQREADVQRELYYERLAQQAAQTELSARLGRTAAEHAAANANRAQSLQEQQASWENVKRGGSSALGAAQGGIDAYIRSQQVPSDVRAKYMVSDANAKRKAFSDGINYAQAFHEGKKQNLPEYASDAPSRVTTLGKAAGKPAARPDANAQRQYARDREAAEAKDAGETSGLVSSTVAAAYPGGMMAAPVIAGIGANASRQAAPPPQYAVDVGQAQMETQPRYAVDVGAAGVERPRYAGMVPSDERGKSGKVSASDDAMASAARSMEPSAYAYKPEYLPPEQKPGEVNVGPMAQNMAADPVARTAVVRRPDGMLALDKDKSLKLVMGSLASIQKQVDGMKKRQK